MANIRDPRTELGSLIRRRRLALNMVQSDLAERAGLSQESISAIERGKASDPRFATLQAIANALDLDVAELLMAREMGRTRSSVTRFVTVAQGEELAVPEQVLPRLFPRLSAENVEALIRFAKYLEAEQVSKPASRESAPVRSERDSA